VKDNDAVAERTVIFVHIPKTAGTTLYQIIDRNYAPDAIHTARPADMVRAIKTLDDARKAKIRILRAHAGFGLHESLPGPWAYFTILRDPIERVISYYYDICRTPQHGWHKQAKSMGLKGFVESGLDAMMENGQTRLASGLEVGYEVGFEGTAFAQEVKDFQKANRLLSPFMRLYWEARKVPVRTLVRQWTRLGHDTSGEYDLQRRTENGMVSPVKETVLSANFCQHGVHR